jgi:5S rRNA maturation endonuclease (ribonuclease M5)
MHKYAEHIAKVARDLWGDENKRLSHGHELRFGSHGSKSVDTEKGTWFDHETQEAGGFVDLCKLAYPEANGHMADFLDSKFRMEKDPAFTKKASGQITVYDYIGDHGVLEYQVIRTDFSDGSKTFRQRRPDGQGGWISNLKDVRRIPYNLPEVLHRKDRWVWVVEGEKCVERLKELGIVATTNNGGSGNWSDDLNEWFADRKIIVVPDNDEAGHKHATKVVNQLLPVAKEIRVLDLSEELGNKGDIVDYLDSGKTKEQLAAKVKAAQVVTDQLPDLGEVEQEQPAVFDTMAIGQLLSMPPVKFLVDGLCTRFGFSVMYGPPGCGKTFIALDMALCVATGRDFHGMDVDQGAVLYIAGEGVGGLGKRIRAWIENRGNGITDKEIPFDVLPTAVNLTDAGETEKLIQTIRLLEDRRGIKFSMVVVDTVARALLGADENSATDIGKFVRACDLIREAVGCAVLGIHHSGKDGGKGMRGSSALLGAVDTSIKIKKSGNQLTIETEKQKDAEPAEDLFFEMTSADVGTFGGETSVYLVPLTADQVASGKATLNDAQLKAMNCLRDATNNGVISPEVAKDSFIYWLAEKEELDPHDRRTKDRARKAWRRSLDALIDANIVSVRGSAVEWVKETQKGSDFDAE